MRNIDRLLSFGFSWWIFKSLRQLRRGALMTCLFVAMTALEAPWANAVEQFGEVHFPIACHAGVQKKFDLALVMLHTFSFPAAAKEFTAVSQEDPDCAMAYWGLAATAIGSLYGGRPANGSEFFESGERVIALGSYSGRARRTGKRFTARFAHVWTLQDGLIVRLQQCADTVQLARALAD